MVSPIGEIEITKQLRGVAAKLTSDLDLRDDLMQEMHVHLLRAQAEKPHQTRSWYIKGCEFHARNQLKRGRSIDSHKRAGNGVPLFQEGDEFGVDHHESVHLLEPADQHGELINEDILALLLPRLTGIQQEILFLLMKGTGVRETARELGVTHPAVVKQRKKIATIARRIIDEKDGDVLATGCTIHVREENHRTNERKKGMKGNLINFFARRQCAAFTLIEQLFVVTIIAILAALVLPALRRAWEFADRAKCLNNQHQIALAMTMTASENNGLFPPYVYNPITNNVNGVIFYTVAVSTNWSMAQIGQITKPDILVCPSDKNPSILTMISQTGTVVSVKCSYGYNFMANLKNIWFQHAGGQRAATTVLLFDGNPAGATAGFYAKADPASKHAPLESDDDLLASLKSGLNSTWDSLSSLELIPSADAQQITICHSPPGNPSNTNTLTIGIAALGAHIGNHGNDCLGPCGSGCNMTAYSMTEFNNMVLERPHFNKANVTFMDGHAEFLSALPTN